jgi:hypothetical protein
MIIIFDVPPITKTKDYHKVKMWTLMDQNTSHDLREKKRKVGAQPSSN